MGCAGGGRHGPSTRVTLPAIQKCNALTRYRHIMKKTSEIQRKNEILAKVARIMKGKKPKDKIMHAENLLRFCMRRQWIKLHLRDFSGM